jgi:hypothetical protein
MIGLHFHKDYAQAVLNALNTGQPIPPPASAEWNRHAMLTLAAILYATVFSQGPPTYEEAGLTRADFEAMHPEKREAVEQFFKEEIHGGIDYLSKLTFQVLDDKYDEDYEPEMTAALFRDNEGLTVQPVRGFKHLGS